VNLAPNSLLHELGEENSVNPWTGRQLSMRQNMSLLKKLDNFLQKYSIVKLSSSAIHVKIQLYVHQMCVTFHYRYMLKFWKSIYFDGEAVTYFTIKNRILSTFTPSPVIERIFSLYTLFYTRKGNGFCLSFRLHLSLILVTEGINSIFLTSSSILHSRIVIF
jgi:hypothetical protein